MMGTAQIRYLNHWVDFAKSNQLDLRKIEGEFGQIRLAWEMLITEGQRFLPDPDRHSLILELMFSIDHFMERFGLLQENIAWISQAMEAAHALKQFHFVGRLGQDLGWCYRELGDLERAMEYLQLALAVRQRYGAKEGEANTLNMIGVVFDDQGNSPKAIEYFEKALGLWIEVQNKEREAITRNNLAASYSNQGEWNKAEEQYNLSLRINQELGKEDDNSGTLNNLGEVALAQGRPEEAEKHFRSALEIFERNGDKAHVPTAMNNLALVKKQLGRVTSAIELMNDALNMQRQLGQEL